MNTFLSIRETADLCGVHTKTVKGWEVKGYLSAHLTSDRQRCYKKEEVEEWHAKYSALDDITGRIFYPWQVIRRHDNNHRLWHVECKNCGIQATKNKYETIRSGGCRNCSLLQKGYAGLNNLLVTYKNNAKKYKREFSFDIEQFREITSAVCHYCGSPPAKTFACNKGRNKKSRWGDYTFNGIDRLDNSLGYTPHNCVPCCHVCNRAKNNMKVVEFVKYITRIHENAVGCKIPCLRRRQSHI